MSDKPINKKNSFKPPQRTGYQFWLIVTLVILIIGFTYLTKMNSAVETTLKQIKEMLRNQDVERVEVVNKEVVEITLTSEALKKEEV